MRKGGGGPGGFPVRVREADVACLRSLVPAGGLEFTLGTLGAEHQDFRVRFALDAGHKVRPPTGGEPIALKAAVDASEERSGSFHPRSRLSAAVV